MNNKNKSIIDKYKGSGKSFAEISEEISKKYKNRDFDLLQKRAFEEELKLLQKEQEKMKMNKQVEEIFKYGGMIKKKYQDGGFTGINSIPGVDVPLTEDPFIGMNPNLPFVDFPFKSMLATSTPSTTYDNLSGIISPSDIGTMPVNPNQVATRQVADVENIQATDDTVFPSDNPLTLGNNRTPSTSSSDRDPSAYTPALVGQGLSTAINLGILAGGYDKEEPITNPLESQALRQLSDRSIDTTQQRNQILSAYNAAKENLSNVRSANVRNALQTNLMNQTGEGLAQSKLSEQAVNAQFQGELASALGNFGQQRAQAEGMANELNARNKGQFLSNLSAFGASTAESSKFFTEKNLNSINNDMLLNILNQKYSTFGIDKSFSERLSQGKTTPEDFVTLKNAVGEEAANNIIERFKLKTD